MNNPAQAAFADVFSIENDFNFLHKHFCFCPSYKDLTSSYKIKTLGKIFALFLVTVGLLSFMLMATIPPMVAFAEANTQSLAVDKPLSFNLNLPLDSAKVKFSISPKIPGNIKFSKGVFGDYLSKEIVFEPTQSLNPNTTYKVSIENVASFLPFSQSKNYTFSFQTKNPPKIAGTNLENTEQISPEQNIEVKLSDANNHLALFNFDFQPKVNFKSTLSSNGKSYILSPTEPLKQGVDYHLVVKRSLATFNLLNNNVVSTNKDLGEENFAFTTTPPPNVTNVSATQNTASTGTLTLTFAKAMNKPSVEKGFSITPKINYKTSWVDEKTLSLIPESKFDFNTTYAIKILGQTKAVDKSFFENDFTYSFTTIGNVKVVSFSPAQNSYGIGLKSQVSVFFDQAVEHNSAQSHFSLSPSAGGSFSWNGNQMIFTPSSSYNYYQKYSVTISAGVKSLTALDSINSFQSYFTTQQETFNLAVPIYRQAYSLSCEAAAIRMVLAYRGLNFSEDYIISQMPIDTTPKSGETWGNPNIGFVGDPKGKWLESGYGAYWNPVATTLNKFRSASTYTGWNLTSLLTEVKAGNPVIAWGCTTCKGAMYWNDSNGNQVYAYTYEHTYVVKGFIGSVNNPTTIIVADSSYGQELRLTTQQFLSKWSVFNNAAIVVK